MFPVIRFTLAWIAAWCQVAVVVAMPLGPLTAPDPLGDVPICHTDDGSSQPGPVRHDHNGHECVLCAACQMHTGTVALLAPIVPLPGPRIVTPARFAIASPRAPPDTVTLAAFPRGPPASLS